MFKGNTQKLIENWGPILLWIATGAPPISQIPIRFTRILTCEDNMQKPCEHRKMLPLFRLFLENLGGRSSVRRPFRAKTYWYLDVLSFVSWGPSEEKCVFRISEIRVALSRASVLKDTSIWKIHSFGDFRVCKSY